MASEHGTNIIRGVQLAVESRPAGEVELILEDDRTDPKQAVSAFQALRQRKVDAIIGATWDFPSLPVIPLAREYKIPLLNVSVVVESLGLRGSGDYGFVLSPSAESESRPITKWLEQEKVRSVVVLSVSNSWGEAHKAQALERLKESGVEVLQQHTTSTMDDNDWRPLIPRIRALKPDGIVFFLNRGDIEQVLRRLREVALELPLYSSGNAGDALRLAADKTLFKRLCYSYPLSQLKNGAFQEQYQKHFGEPARVYSDYAYDAVNLLLAAKRQSNGGPLRDAIEQLTYDGIVGRYQFDPRTSLSTGRSTLLCVHGSEPTPVAD